MLGASHCCQAAVPPRLAAPRPLARPCACVCTGLLGFRLSTTTEQACCYMPLAQHCKADHWCKPRLRFGGTLSSRHISNKPLSQLLHYRRGWEQHCMEVTPDDVAAGRAGGMNAPPSTAALLPSSARPGGCLFNPQSHTRRPAKSLGCNTGCINAGGHPIWGTHMGYTTAAQTCLMPGCHATGCSCVALMLPFSSAGCTRDCGDALQYPRGSHQLIDLCV